MYKFPLDMLFMNNCCIFAGVFIFLLLSEFLLNSPTIGTCCLYDIHLDPLYVQMYMYMTLDNICVNNNNNTNPKTML